MPPNLLLKTLVSFFAAGLWIGGATLLTERLGSRKGGLIANLPSTVMIALIFVALVNDAEYAAQASRAIPVGMTIDTLFLLIFIILLKKSLVLATVSALVSWLGLAITAGAIGPGPVRVTILIYLLVVILSFALLEQRFYIPARTRNRKNFSLTNALSRALFAGSVVAGTTIISAYAGTYWVGLFSTFPAVMLSSMVILTLNQGREFARATGKVMILSSTNIIIYGLAVAATYPVLGIILGTALSFLCSLSWILLMHPLIKVISK